jgi:regulator of extracellular matrix RemA (YlzA/DUF370 family)
MKTILTVLNLLLCIGIGTAHAAEEWQSIPTNSPNITFSIDKGTQERNGNQVKFWEKITYAKPEVKDDVSGNMIKEKKIRRIMNCADKTQGLISGITYGENGRFITSISLDDTQIRLSAIPPNTVAAAEFALVCAKPPDAAH